MMETDHNQILHFENVDKREVGLHSPNMEREGLIRCLNFLIGNGVQIKEVVTDSSTSVAKTLGKHFSLHIIAITCGISQQLIIQPYTILVTYGIKLRS